MLQISVFFTLCVIGVLGFPDIGLTTTSNSILVKWTYQPPEIPAYMYTIQILNEPPVLLSTYASFYEFSSDLKPETIYRISLITFSLQGEKLHYLLDPKTLPAIPNAPSDLTVKVLNKNVKLTWKAPIYSGKLLEYVVGYRDGDSTETVVNHNGLEIVLKNLPDSKRLYFTVKATTAAGVGPPARYGPLTVPAIQMDGHLKVTLLNKFDVLLTWTLPQTTCDIYSNNIYYSTDSFAKKKTIIPAATAFTLKGLDAGKDYEFTVTGDCMSSEGSGTISVKLSIPPQPPSKPQNVTIAEVGQESVTVQWKKPFVMSGELNMYRIRAMLSSTVISEKNENNDKFSTTLIGLNSATEYTIRVDASTHGNANYGPSAIIRVTTLSSAAQIPAKPDPFSVTKNFLNVVELSWSYESSPPLPQITGFLLTYITGSGFLTSLELPSNQLTIKLTNLKKDTPYTFTLKAMNNEIFGAPATLQVDTFAGAPELPTNTRVVVVSPTSAKVSWDTLAEVSDASEAKAADSMMIVKAYVGSKLVAKQETPLNVGSCILQPLIGNTETNVYIQTRNPGPLGGFSDEMMIATIVTFPGAPREPGLFKATSHTPRSLQIILSSPTDLSIPVKDYTVKLYNNATGSFIKSITQANPDFTVPELTPWMIYRGDAFCNGFPKSDGTTGWQSVPFPFVVQTLPLGNMAPIQGSVTPVDNFTIKVEWKAPKDYLGEVTGYKLRVSTVRNNEEIINTWYPPNVFSAVVPGLNPGTTYSGRVASEIKQTIGGEGISSTLYILMGEGTTKGYGPDFPEVDEGGDGNLVQGGGLGGGAIAGIVIGVLIALVLIVLIVLFMRRRRQPPIEYDLSSFWTASIHGDSEYNVPDTEVIQGEKPKLDATKDIEMQKISEKL